MKRSAISFAVLALTTSTLSCGSDSPTHTLPGADISGSYTATQWVTTGGSGSTNQLLAGSTLNINLNPSGTTTGHLHVAGSGANAAFDADMAGTWVISGNTVTFSQSADTFVRNMPFTLVANGPQWALVGDQVFSDTRIQLTLTRA